MEIVKKNLASIIFGVIALLALVAWIWPLGSIREEGQNALATRIGTYKSMQGLVNAQRTMPVLSPKGGEPQPLGMFPTKNVIEWGEKITKDLANEAQGVKAVALRLNTRQLLVPNSLPVPAPTTEFKFRDVYKRYVQEFPRIVKAGTPPTQEEIAAASKELWETKYAPQIIIRDGRPDPVSQQQVTQEFNKEQPEVPTRLKLERARGILFYMYPQAMDVSTHFASAMGATGTPTAASGAAPTAPAIWDAQVRVWVQNDIAQAIVDLNTKFSKTGSVVDAPVKQLVKVSIEGFRAAAATGVPVPGGSDMGGGGMPPDMGGGMMGAPPDAMMMMGGGAPAGAGTGGPAADSLTGRKSNPLYDVLPFRIVVHIEADKLPDLLEELGRNRFITPTQVVSMRSLDSVVLNASTNMVYGSAPVVEAVISCEALLLRDWTVPLMPREIKIALGLEAAAPAAGM